MGRENFTTRRVHPSWLRESSESVSNNCYDAFNPSSIIPLTIYFPDDTLFGYSSYSNGSLFTIKSCDLESSNTFEIIVRETEKRTRHSNSEGNKGRALGPKTERPSDRYPGTILDTRRSSSTRGSRNQCFRSRGGDIYIFFSPVIRWRCNFFPRNNVSGRSLYSFRFHSIVGTKLVLKRRENTNFRRKETLIFVIWRRQERNEERDKVS